MIAQSMRMRRAASTTIWDTDRAKIRYFDGNDIIEEETERQHFDINILPRDITRRTSDIYQLTYPQALEYIHSVERIGAGGVDLPKVQLYGRMGYPISIINEYPIGFSLAAKPR